MNDHNTLSGKELTDVSNVAQKNPPSRILVVDDDPDTRQLSVDILVSANFEVDSAVDGADGWEALRAKHFDLVVTDNKMPRMTGIELIKKLRYTRLPLPVIMATNQLPTQEFEQKPWLLPDATLQRPFSNDDLLETVKKVMRIDYTNWNHIAMHLRREI